MRNIADTGIGLPANPEFIDFPMTDGNVSNWPPNTTRVVDHEGQVNYYEYIPPEHSQNIRWRLVTGDAISLKLGLPEGKNYVLRDFPEGYRLYDHNKGPHDGPRHDLYLFGPMKKRFRSINEFIPHAIWLMGDSSNDCECKYCAKKAQREITASMSNILRLTPTQSPTPRAKVTRDKGKGKDKGPMNRIRIPRPREPRAYAAVQRVFKQMRPSPGIIQQPMLVERNNDLRAIYTKTSMHLRRWFRDGEVVWCALENPIPGPDGIPNASIDFWPAVIEEIKLKTEPIPRNASNASSSRSPTPQAPQASSSAMQIDSLEDGNTIGPILENSDEPLPWIVRQSTRYKVQLLAVSQSRTIDDEMVLPYQAYVPTDDLISSMTEFPTERLNFDKNALLEFNPSPLNSTPTFSEAVSAFATALQIASILSSTWCLTDDYTVRYSIPPSSKPSPKTTQRPISSQSASTSSQPAPPMTLEAAIESASRHNAQVSRNVTAINTEMSEREVQKTAHGVLGIPPPSSNPVQTRFQGLWWGPERIWTDDFIRLKIPRRTIGPKGGPNLLSASGPGKAATAQWISEGKDPAELGAGTRGVFLRLDGIIAVDVVNDQGVTKKEARICGMLYELADEDWDDPLETKTQADTLEGFAGPTQPQTQAQPQTPGPSSQDPFSSNGTSIPQNGQPPISGPVRGSLLPQAPLGYRFRPIVAPGYEFVGAMGLISGRYYPGILSHPKTRPRVQAALSRPVEDGGVAGFDNLWSLEGLSGGYFNSIDPHRYKKSRVIMMQDADKQALDELQSYVDLKLQEINGDAMEVDVTV